MNPQVRETTETPIAAPLTPVSAELFNAIPTPQIAKSVVEIKAPAPTQEEDQGPSMLDKRRRRRARLSNRH